MDIIVFSNEDIPFSSPSKHTLEYNFVYIIGIPIGCFGGIGALLGLSLSNDNLPEVYTYLLQNDHIIIIANIILGHTLVSSIYRTQAH